MPSVDDVERSNAGVHLFNGITQMSLIRENGDPVLFSYRRELTRRFIGQLLEMHLVPAEFAVEVAAWAEQQEQQTS